MPAQFQSTLIPNNVYRNLISTKGYLIVQITSNLVICIAQVTYV